MNFVTKDFCKCLIEPKFIIPEYSLMSKFQEEYMRKECFREDFKMKLYLPLKKEVLVCEKKSQFSLEKIKNMVIKKMN